LISESAGESAAQCQAEQAQGATCTRAGSDELLVSGEFGHYKAALVTLVFTEFAIGNRRGGNGVCRHRQGTVLTLAYLAIIQANFASAGVDIILVRTEFAILATAVARAICGSALAARSLAVIVAVAAVILARIGIRCAVTIVFGVDAVRVGVSLFFLAPSTAVFIVVAIAAVLVTVRMFAVLIVVAIAAFLVIVGVSAILIVAVCMVILESVVVLIHRRVDGRVIAGVLMPFLAPGDVHRECKTSNDVHVENTYVELVVSWLQSAGQ
jgi:hypothetical protein